MRIGRIRIADFFITNPEYHGQLFAIFSKAIPLDVKKNIFGSHVISREYVCLCDSFDEIEEGGRIPSYDVTISRDCKCVFERIGIPNSSVSDGVRKRGVS